MWGGWGGGGVKSLDKSAFFWTRRDFDYGYGVGFRGRNTSNLDKGVLQEGGNSVTCEQRSFVIAISIHVGDLLISGSEMFTGYSTQRTQGAPKRIEMEKTKRRIRG